LAYAQKRAFVADLFYFPALSPVDLQSCVFLLLDIRKILSIAFSHYRPQLSDLRITLFMAQESAEAQKAITREAWTYVSKGNLEIIDVGGSHSKMLEEPHVDAARSCRFRDWGLGQALCSTAGRVNETVAPGAARS
jgi:hypothetical protein